MDKNIATKLGKIQQSLFVPKGNKNTFGGYNYRSCEDILKALKPLLEGAKCSVFLTSDTRAVGNWVYVFAKATLVDNESGESIEVEAQAREPEIRKGMDAAQVSGSSLSYARKYALAGMFGIDNEKDPDATNDHGKSAPDEKKVTASQILRESNKAKAWAMYKAIPDNADVELAVLAENYRKLCETIGGKDPKSFTESDWGKVVDSLK